jgi:hypothetical protein
MGQEIVIVEFQGPLAAKASTPSGGVWLQLLSDEGAELSRDCEVLRVVSISPTEPTDSQAAKIEQRLENDQVRRMRQSGVCPWCGGHV